MCSNTCYHARMPASCSSSSNISLWLWCIQAALLFVVAFFFLLTSLYAFTFYKRTTDHFSLVVRFGTIWNFTAVVVSSSLSSLLLLLLCNKTITHCPGFSFSHCAFTQMCVCVSVKIAKLLFFRYSSKSDSSPNLVSLYYHKSKAFFPISLCLDIFFLYIVYFLRIVRVVYVRAHNCNISFLVCCTEIVCVLRITNICQGATKKINIKTMIIHQTTTTAKISLMPIFTPLSIHTD